jgi:hypothetical protein
MMLSHVYDQCIPHNRLEGGAIRSSLLFTEKKSDHSFLIG